uniref:Uncharacterized protein n=1 Tax=Knipowitschia caucasica TaxID=637954 RepID=A0AAV2K3Z9_KNICA
MSGILKRKFEEVEAAAASPCSLTRESDDEVSCSESGDSSDSVNPAATGPITPAAPRRVHNRVEEEARSDGPFIKQRRLSLGSASEESSSLNQ